MPFERPLEHLREYVTVLRGLLWDGSVNFPDGNTGSRRGWRAARAAAHPHAGRGAAPAAFRLAGETRDGGISWLCPVP